METQVELSMVRLLSGTVGHGRLVRHFVGLTNVGAPLWRLAGYSRLHTVLEEVLIIQATALP